MEWTNDFSTVRVASVEQKLDDQGGVIPTSQERAKEADFITLPEGIEGTNCGNCLFVRRVKEKGDFHCVHPEIRMPVNNRNCCKFWDAHNTGRHFKFNNATETLS
jgi:hypothetical protein